MGRPADRPEIAHVSPTVGTRYPIYITRGTRKAFASQHSFSRHAGVLRCKYFNFHSALLDLLRQDLPINLSLSLTHTHTHTHTLSLSLSLSLSSNTKLVQEGYNYKGISQDQNSSFLFCSSSPNDRSRSLAQEIRSNSVQ